MSLHSGGEDCGETAAAYLATSRTRVLIGGYRVELPWMAEGGAPVATSFEIRTRSRGHRIAAFLASRDKDWLLGAFAGEPRALDQAISVCGIAGVASFLATRICSGVFHLGLDDSVKAALGAGAALLAGAVAIRCRQTGASRGPSRTEKREASIREQLGLLMRPGKDGLGSWIGDPKAAALVASISAKLPGLDAEGLVVSGGAIA